MKNVNEMTAEQVTGNMDKTIIAIEAAKERGCTAERPKGKRLVAQYDELKEFMEDCGVWAKYCESRIIDSAIDGTDLFS